MKPSPITHLTLLKAALLVAAISCLSACGLYGYGPAEDHSRFVTAKPLDGGKAVLFSCQRLVYRPAAGWRAFPDGGIPKYIVDDSSVGVYDLADRKLRILSRRKNTYRQDGQGEFFISQAKGSVAVISEGGQKRSDYLPDAKLYLLDTNTGGLTPLAVKEELASCGRGVGYFYLLDGMGTILFVTPPLDKQTGVNPNDPSGTELWLRYPSGQYVKVGSDCGYYGFQDGEVIYWSLADRSLHAFDVNTRLARVIERYMPPVDAGPTVDVRLSSPDARGIELWEKVGGTWVYREPLIKIADVD